MYIELTQGKYAIVDESDYESISRFKWCFSHGYALRKNNGKTQYMHQLINNTPAGMVTDHINRDRLDNRRANLRSVTRSVNNSNRNPVSVNASGLKNIYWDKQTNKWRVKVGRGYKTVHLGRFTKLPDALSTLKNWEEQLHDIAT